DLVRHRLDSGSQNGQGGAQLVRRIGCELTLAPEPLFETTERLVDGDDERQNLFGISSVGNLTSIRIGMMRSARPEGGRSGLTARRKMTMSAASSTRRIGIVIHPTL